MALSMPSLSLAAFARAHPFAVGASAATVKAATADVMIQKCVEKRDEIDVKRVAVFTTFCFGFTGCWQYYLYNRVRARVAVTAAASLLWTSYVSFSRRCPGPCPQNAPTQCDGVGTKTVT